MKNITFVFRITSLFSYSSSIIDELCSQKNNVTLVFMKENSNDSTIYKIRTNKDTGFKELITENPMLGRQEKVISESKNLKIINGIERKDIWKYLLRIIRETISLISYFQRNDRSVFLYNQKRYVPKIINYCLSYTIFQKYLLPINLIYKIFRKIHQIIPASKSIKLFIKSLNTNCVVVVGGNWPTNHNYFSSEIDYIKACSKLKIPSVIQVVSWDNLTARGIYHYSPNLMLAWNQIHKEEAFRIHNIPKEKIKITGSPVMDKWFDQQNNLRKKEKFFHDLNIDPNIPLITYLGSSKNIVGRNEKVIVEKIFKILKKKGIQMIIRPHGGNSGQFKSLASQIPVIPLQGDLPDTNKSEKLMIETLIYSSVCIGINTTAMIDSVVLGTPCITLIKKEFDLGQSLTAHFKNIRKNNIFPEVFNEEDACEKIEKIIHEGKSFINKNEIENFCRPQGNQISSGKMASQFILSLLKSN
tara:strand:+ start:584 stop:1999 length:1416 start_codon:yes stop_codon:yes gene_type:complete